MVKVTFIVEGKVEKILIDTLSKQRWFTQYGIEKVGPTIDAQGGGNLCPDNLEEFILQANTFNPDKIIILTDMECDPCVQKAKERIGNCSNCILILAKQTIESWFLADDELLTKLSEGKCSNYPNPEATPRKPYETFKLLAKRLNVRGPGRKVMFAKKVLNIGFDIKRAAINAPSAQYFLQKLQQIGRNEL